MSSNSRRYKKSLTPSWLNPPRGIEVSQEDQEMLNRLATAAAEDNIEVEVNTSTVNVWVLYNHYLERTMRTEYAPKSKASFE